MDNYLFESDRLAFRNVTLLDNTWIATMNQDKEVMTYFPAPMTEDQTKVYIEKITTHQKTYGYSMYVAELKESGVPIGLIGLLTIGFESDIKGEVEIGWRLLKDYWHKGYASEGATAVLDYAFNNLNIPRVYSFTATINTPSKRVMTHVGMTYMKKFDHPNVADSSRLKEHVLYKINKENPWQVKLLSQINTEELRQLIDIWYKTNQEAHHFIKESYWKNHIPYLKEELPKAEVIVVLLDEKIIAFAGVVGDYIAGIFVTSKYQKMGIGTVLLNRLKEMKVTLSLSVYQKNQQAYRFYLRQGFKVIKESLDEENKEVELVMKWQR